MPIVIKKKKKKKKKGQHDSPPLVVRHVEAAKSVEMTCISTNLPVSAGLQHDMYTAYSLNIQIYLLAYNLVI